MGCSFRILIYTAASDISVVIAVINKFTGSTFQELLRLHFLIGMPGQTGSFGEALFCASGDEGSQCGEIRGNAQAGISRFRFHQKAFREKIRRFNFFDLISLLSTRILHFNEYV